jgi:glycosyltransferase involved in cell wall biosynthesis
MSTPSILIIHNYYRLTGGEDTVVLHETAALKEAGAHVHELYFHNPGSGNSVSRLVRFMSGIFFNIGAFWKVFRLVKKKNIKVVHVHNVFYQATPSVFWAARWAGARVVATVHNYRLFCLNALFYRKGGQCTVCYDKKSFAQGIKSGCFKGSRWQSFFLAASLRLHWVLGTWHKAVDQFIIINPIMHEYLAGCGIHPQNIYFKPNCIADKPFAGYERRSDFYLIAGRLEKEKGLPEVLDAWTQLPFPLHIAGAGTMQQEIEAAHDGQITYLGQLHQHAMQEALSSCRAVIFASKLLEGMPLSIIEAMATGAICIAHATAVTRKLVQDGVTGWLFQHDDGGKSLRQAIMKVEAMTLAEKINMSEAARRTYVENYSIREHLRHISNVYKIKLMLPPPAQPVAEMAHAHASGV